MTAKLQNYIIQVEFYSSIYNAIIKLSSSHQNYHKHTKLPMVLASNATEHLNAAKIY